MFVCEVVCLVVQKHFYYDKKNPRKDDVIDLLASGGERRDAKRRFDPVTVIWENRTASYFVKY